MTIASALQNVDCPAVEWTGGQFLVAISYGQLNRRDIEVVTITGTNVGALQNVVTDSGDSRSPKLIANGATTVVTWQDAGGANTSVLRRPLSATGTPTAVTATLSGAVSTNSPPAITTFGTGFVVAWAATNGPHFRVLDGNGNATGVERVLSNGTSATTNDPLAVAALSAGTNVALAWCAFGGNEQNTAVSDATGTATGAVKMFAAPASRQPVLAKSPAGFGLVYLETSGLVQLHLAVLDPTGQVVRDVPLSNATTSSRATLKWTGTHYLAAYDSNQGSFVKFIPPP